MSITSKWFKSQPLKRVVATAALTAATAVGGVAVALPADAATSPSTNGCYAWWSGTHADAHCQPASANGYYRLAGNCEWEPGYIGRYVYFQSGAGSDGWEAFGCTWGVSSALIEYHS